MALYDSSGTPSKGSLNIDSFLSLPKLPTIVTEWAALIPLAMHLASFRTDYYTTGHIAFLGYISVSLFPKLGVLSSLSRLCQNGPEYLDQASIRGSSSRTVRDVRWGSVFPCANGALSATIADYAINRATGAIIQMPSNVKRDHADSQFKTSDSPHRRFQTLHVLDFSRTSVRGSTLLSKLERTLSAKVVEWSMLFLLIGISVILGLCGLYGTAVILSCGAVAQVAASFVRVERPPGYLQNNESHSACMLVATHRNSNTWYLYVGDRGVVDTLLNKTMVSICPTRETALMSNFFAFAHLVHLVAITYVAAQKGWDGVALVVLMLLNWLLRFRFSNKYLCEEWLDSEGVAVTATSFQFTGRTIMLGAIQAFSGSDVTAWMDEIVTPHPRRDAWLKIIGSSKKGGQAGHESSFDQFDWAVIERTSQLALLGAEVLKKHLATTQRQKPGHINQV